MTELSTDFRYADVVKARKVRDADGDGKVYDNTPRERPATPAEMVRGAKPRGVKVPRRPARPAGMASNTPDPKNKRMYDIEGVDAKGKKVLVHADDRDHAIAVAQRWQRQGVTDIVAHPRDRNVSGEPLALKKPDAPKKRVAAKKPVKPKSPFDDGMVTNSRGEREDVGNRAERKMVEAEVNDERRKAQQVDFEAADLKTDEEQKAGQLWHDAMHAAATGDQATYRGNLAAFFMLEEKNGGSGWGETIMDKVDDWFDDKNPKNPMLDKATKNIKDWKALPSSERKKWAKVSGAKKPAGIPGGPENKALYDHLVNGGSVMDAPVGDLMAVVKAMPDRFDVFGLGGEGGVSDSNWVIDKDIDTGLEVQISHGRGKFSTTKEALFVKKSYFEDDVLAEVMVGNVLKEADMFGVAVPVQFAAKPQGGRGRDYMVMPHVGQADIAVWDEAYDNFRANQYQVLDFNTKYDGNGKTLGEMIAEGPDPGSPMRLALFDFLIGNSRDRHAKNVLITVDENSGVAMAPIDHGLAFWNGDGPGGNLSQFAQHTRPKGNFKNGLIALGKDRSAVSKELRNTVAKMKKVNIAKQKKALKDQKPPLSPEMMKQVNMYFDDMAERIKWLDANHEEALDVLMGMA